jgi:hypothetical protein
MGALICRSVCRVDPVGSPELLITDWAILYVKAIGQEIAINQGLAGTASKNTLTAKTFR